VNIDFQAEPLFSAYVLLLMFSGIAMIVMASPTVKRSTMGLRALNALFGVAFLGYGFYLAFLFHGGSYFILFKAFILPILLIVRTIKGARARSQQRPAYASGPVPQQAAAPAAEPVAQPGAPLPAPAARAE
jgi:predicted lipid-binding transport protein (Tim44 family)